MIKVHVIVCVLTLMDAGPVIAQEAPPLPSERRLFVDGRLFTERDQDFTSTYTQATGFGAGVGALLSRRTSLRFEIEVPAWHRREWDRLLDYRDPNSGRIINGPVTTRTAVRTVSYGALFGIHGDPSRHVRLAFLMGLSGTNRADTTSNSYPGTDRIIGEGTFTESAPALSFGVDLQIRLTPRLSIVPQMRAHSRFSLPYFDAFMFRPGVGLLWKL